MKKDILERHSAFLADKFRGKRILVSGATGLLGSNLVYYLTRLNDLKDCEIQIIALYREEQKKERVFSALYDRQDIRFVKCDVEKQILFDGYTDYVVHCAALSGGVARMHLNDPIKIFDTGMNGTRQILDWAVLHGCKGFLYLSSYEVYGNCDPDNYVTEDSECHLDTFILRNCYAEVKRICESLLCAFEAKYGIHVFSARLTSTFGKGVRYDDPRFFAEFARCIIEHRDIVLKSEGRTVRSYLDAGDAAIAFLYILASGSSCNAYNLTNMDNEISIKDMAQKMIELTGSDIKLIVDKNQKAENLGYRKEGRAVMDASKLQELGWLPVYSLEETLHKLLDSMSSAKHFGKGNCLP